MKWSRYRLILSVFIGMYLLSSVVQSLQLMNENRGPSPALQMAGYVQDFYKHEDVVIFTWEEERTFQYYAKGYLAKRVKSFEHFNQLRKEYRNLGKTLLVSNKVIEGFNPKHRSFVDEHLLTKAEFKGHSLVFPVYDQLTLYEWTDELKRKEHK
jgi:hypothetical protein